MWRFLFCTLVLGAVLFAGGNHPAALSDLKVHDPIQQGNLTIFPLSGGVVADTSGFLTLDEGLKQGLVKVGELGALRGTGVMVRPPIAGGPERMPRPIIQNPAQQVAITGDGARVNELAIQNLSDKPLLLLAGEVVSGGKQDRVVSKDRIVPPHSEPVPLGVFCVEPGRWSGTTAHFAASKAMAHPNLRKEVTENRNQQKVWDEVAKANRGVTEAVMAYSASSGVVAGGVAAAAPARPGSFAQVIEHRPVQDKLAADSRIFLDGIPRNARGVVVALDGRPVWADVFASPSLFERYRAKLLQSYQVEAMRSGAGAAPNKPATRSESSGSPATEAEARTFLRALDGRKTIDVEPGVFRLVRTDASGLVTYELISTGQRDVTVHLARMPQ